MCGTGVTKRACVYWPVRNLIFTSKSTPPNTYRPRWHHIAFGFSAWRVIKFIARTWRRKIHIFRTGSASNVTCQIQERSIERKSDLDGVGRKELANLPNITQSDVRYRISMFSINPLPTGSPSGECKLTPIVCYLHVAIIQAQNGTYFQSNIPFLESCLSS